MSSTSNEIKQETSKTVNKKSDVAAQNIITKKITQSHKDINTMHKQKASSSNTSIDSSSKIKDNDKIIKHKSTKIDKKLDEKLDEKLDKKSSTSSKSTSRSSSRPNSKASDRNEKKKKETSKESSKEISKESKLIDLNKSTQSIQGRPESKRSNKTDQSSLGNEDSTSNSILSLNSNSLGAGQSSNNTSDQIVTSSELNSINSINQLNQSQTSLSSTASKTLPRRETTKKIDSTTTSTTSITSTTSQTVSSSNTSGIVTSSQSPIRRRKKPPAPKPPSNSSINTKSSLNKNLITSSNKQIRASNLSNLNVSSKVPASVPINSSNLALSQSNCSLMTTCTETNSSLSMNLTNTTTSDLSNSSATDLNSLRRRKKSSKNKPAPPVPTVTSGQQQQKINQEINLTSTIEKDTNNKISSSSSSCSKQSNKRINNNNSSLRLTPHKTSCSKSVNHRNKSNVKQRINAILIRSLSEAFRLNAKTALNSVQHSFSSEVNLNKRNLSTMNYNTAFTDSFGGQNNNGNHFDCHTQQHRLSTPDAKKKKIEEQDNLTRSDLKKVTLKKGKKKEDKESKINNNNQNDEFLSPFTSSVMDRSFANSNRLVNQLFTTQPHNSNNQNQLIRRCSSLPYLAFLSKKDKKDLKDLSVKANQKISGKRKSAYNVANDLIIETLSNNLYNGSAQEVMYAAELLEEFSENVVAVPPLTSRLAALLSPQHYQKHNLNNQLQLINHYIDCLKHEQEQEELLTVQLIEQQQVNRMLIEINKETKIKEDEICITTDDDKPEISNEIDEKYKRKEEEKDKDFKMPDYIDKLTTQVYKTSKTPPLSKMQATTTATNRTMLTVLNGHESTGSDELHSDTSDGKITVIQKCMPRLQEINLTTSSSSAAASSAATANKQVTASSSGLSNSSSKTLLADNQENNLHKTTTSTNYYKQNLKNLDNLNQQHADNLTTRSSNLSSLKNRHRHHYCTNKNIHCLMHSQSTHCLNEQQHHQLCHQITDESSSSSSQSTRSNEELNWSNSNGKHIYHQFIPSCPIKQQQQFNHLIVQQPNYLNASSSECSTDESYSTDSPMMHHLHHHKNSCLNDLVCACCEKHCEHRTHSHRIKSTSSSAGLFPTTTTNKYLESHCTNQEISNLYDYHSLHLEDMFNAGKKNEINY